MSNFPTVRISCAALCRIEIGNSLLLEVNKNRRNVLTPIGGALKFRKAARPFLESLGAVFEEETDLRLTISRNRLEDFQQWFERRADRETDPARELWEELADEHKVVSRSFANPFDITFLRLISHQEQTSRQGRQGAMTHYFFETFLVQLTPEVLQLCWDAASKRQGRLRLLNEDLIKSGESGEDGLKVAATAKMLVL